MVRDYDRNHGNGYNDDSGDYVFDGDIVDLGDGNDRDCDCDGDDDDDDDDDGDHRGRGGEDG